MKRFLSVICILMLCLCRTMTVFADEPAMDTVNDLFELYNEAQLDDANALKDEYLAMLGRLADAERDIAEAEAYNTLIDEAQKWQAEEKNKISKELKELSQHGREISAQVAESFDGEWDKLLQLDKAYKMNVSKMNQLLVEYDKYSLTAKKIADYDTLDELSAEIAELQKVYKTASSVKVLGDVYHVKYPLGKETVMTSRYGNRVDPITGAAVSFHGGIDLRAAMGTEVLSVFNGVVMGTGYTTTGGYYVNIDHGNGVRSFYCHLSEILCQKGQAVSQYDVIALSGNTGTRTTGPHLHFALYINGNSVNPEVLYNER